MPLPTGSDVTALMPPPPRPVNPFGLGDIVQLFQLQQARELLPLRMQQAQQDLQESKLKLDAATTAAQERLGIKQALAESGGDIDKALPKILQVAPTTGLAFATQARQQQQEELKATGERLKNAITSAQLGAQLLQGVKSSAHPDQAYQWGLRAMKANGLDISQMSSTYDPDQVDQYLASGISAENNLKSQQQQLKDKLEAMGRTKVTAEGIMQQNPATGAFDIKVGEPEKPGAPTVHQDAEGNFHVISPNGTSIPVTENGQPLAGKPPTEGKENDFEQFFTQWRKDNKAPDSSAARLMAKKAWAAAGQLPERPPQAPIVMVPGPNGTMIPTQSRLGVPLAAGAMTTAGMNAVNTPTAATRTMAETAPKVIELADRVSQLVDQQEKYLGPAASRWNEFMAGKVGAPNADFTKLRTDVGLLQTALMRMHVGARGGEQIMEHFADLINSSKQSPENMRAALGEIKAYAQEVAGSGKPPAVNTTAPSVNQPSGRVRTDIPSSIANGIAEGQTRIVNSPTGQIKLTKRGGKLFEE